MSAWLRSRFAPGYEIWGRFHLYEPLVGLGVGRAGAHLRRTAVEALRLRPGGSVIDFGTGTGLTLPYLAAAVGPAGRVAGLDRSPTMLAGARDRAPSPRSSLSRPTPRRFRSTTRRSTRRSRPTA